MLFVQMLSRRVVRYSPGGGGGRDSHLKGMGMLVVSLRGAKFQILVSLRASLHESRVEFRPGMKKFSFT